MSFLNWIMLGGAAALAIPVIIHLFNRSRHRVVPWGAMHLLRTVVQVNRRRLKIQQLLLLLVRCAIPVLLALLMARPVITGWRALAGDVPSSTVVLLDDSYSMDAGQGSGSRFDEAVRQTQAILEQVKRGSDVSVVLTGGGAEPVFDKPVFDARSVVEQLRGHRAQFGASDIVAGFTAGSTMLGQMAHARRDMIVVSDFQSGDWAGLDEPQRKRLAELVTGMDVPASLTFVRIGGEKGEGSGQESGAGRGSENLAVESVVLSKRTIGVGQSVLVRAGVRNYGKQTRRDVRVYCRVDGREAGVTQVTAGPGETTQALFTVSFEEAGSHLVEVAIDGAGEAGNGAGGGAAADNVYEVAVSVLGRIPVLLIDGDASDKPLMSETDFLNIALQPYAAARRGGKLTDLVEAKRVKAEQFNPAMLADRKAVVLANVERLHDAQLAGLRQFVEAGGGLMIFPGNKIDLKWYGGVMSDAERGLAVMRFERIIESGEAAGRGPAAIVDQHFDHPALSGFNDKSQSVFEEAAVRTWYRMVPVQEGGDGARVMMRLDTGDALVVGGQVGRGMVMQWATAADAQWSNLPMRPLYLPLMQQLVVHLATQVEPGRNVEVGKPLVAYVGRELVDEAMSLVGPDGRSVTVRAVMRESGAVVEYGGTRRPGRYVLNLPGKEGGTAAGVIHFVVHAGRAESNPAVLNESELDAVAKSMGATVVRDAQEYAAMDSQRRHGREIWKLVLVAVLAMVFVEMWLEQRFARSGA
jgi:hypothetical protein